MNQRNCPFCNPEISCIYLECEFAVAFFDSSPITQGHTLIVPRRHVASLFELPEEEQAAVWKLVDLVRSKLRTDLKPDGFNIGVNDGLAAGQTVMHAHVFDLSFGKIDVLDMAVSGGAFEMNRRRH